MILSSGRTPTAAGSCVLVKHVRAGEVLVLTLPDQRTIKVRLADRKTRPGTPLAIDLPDDVLVDLERSKVVSRDESVAA